MIIRTKSQKFSTNHRSSFRVADFLYNQEHVTPHLGFTARNFYLDNEFVCNKQSSDPKYNFEQEINYLLERMANLNDYKKGLIELFRKCHIFFFFLLSKEKMSLIIWLSEF